ncbi:hypothetical protein [Actinoplanes sp. NBRC 101535]|nr:hypothetical protein [Actinoplanes sp. NBRC 101535]
MTDWLEVDLPCVLPAIRVEDRISDGEYVRAPNGPESTRRSM